MNTPVCQAPLDFENGQPISLCREPVRYRGEWSDRWLYVCEKHHDYVYECHDGDHHGDQGSILWEDYGEEEYPGQYAFTVEPRGLRNPDGSVHTRRRPDE